MVRTAFSGGAGRGSDNPPPNRLVVKHAVGGSPALETSDALWGPSLAGLECVNPVKLVDWRIVKPPMRSPCPPPCGRGQEGPERRGGGMPLWSFITWFLTHRLFKNNNYIM